MMTANTQDDGTSVYVETYATGDGNVHVQVTKFHGDPDRDPSATILAFDLTSDAAHELGRTFLTQSWEAIKVELGDAADTYRRLGFFN